MRYTLLVLLVAMGMAAPAQMKYTFIGELRYNTANDEIRRALQPQGQQQYPPHYLFIKNYDIKIYKKVPGTDGKDSLENIDSHLKAKEIYYGNDEKRVEIRITVAQKLVQKTGLEVIAKFFHKSNGKLFKESQDFKLQVPGRDREEYINDITFKLDKKVSIGAPAYVGLDLMFCWLKEKLYAPGTEGFTGAMRQLNAYSAAGKLPCITDSAQLKEFYNLYAFIEPYIPSTAFINTEAAELHQQIQQMNHAPAVPDNPEEMGLQAMDSLYREYLRFADSLRMYHRQLSAILFYRTCCTDSVAAPAAWRWTNTTKISFCIGPSYLGFINRDYNKKTIAAAPRDTVVANTPRLLPSLTAGVLFRFVGKAKMKRKNPTSANVKKPVVPGGFTIGLLGHYFIPYRNLDSIFKGSLGPGMALGYTGNRFGVLGSLSFMRDVGDAGKTVLRKWNPALGVSLVISLGKLGNYMLNKSPGGGSR